MNRRFAVICMLVTAAVAYALPAHAAPTPTPTPSPAAASAAASAATPSPGGYDYWQNVPPITLPSGGASPVPLTLHDAKMIAVRQSPQLELARAAFDLAGGTLEIETSAAFPLINATANVGRSRGAVRAGAVGGVNSVLFTSNNAQITIHQLIFDGGSTYARISSARYAHTAARLTALRAIDTVLLNVATAYYTALQARYIYQTAVESRKLAEVQEQLVEAQFKAGVASRADVLTAQLPVAQARLAEVQAANGEESQVAALLNIMGLPSDVAVSLVTPQQPGTQQAPSPIVLPPYESVIAIAATQRTDLQAARASETAAERSVRAARASRWPVITGTASIGAATTGVDSAGNVATNGGNWANTNSFGANATLPLYDSGLINGQIASAVANQRTAHADLVSSELGVSLAVRQAYLGAQTANQGVDAAKVELDQAQTVLDVTNAQYRAGVTTLVLLLNAQVGLTKARSDYVNALFSAYTAQQTLYYAEGVIADR